MGIGLVLAIIVTFFIIVLGVFTFILSDPEYNQGPDTISYEAIFLENCAVLRESNDCRISSEFALSDTFTNACRAKGYFDTATCARACSCDV